MNSKKVTKVTEDLHTHAINHSQNIASFCTFVGYEKSLIQWTTVIEPFQHWEFRRGYTVTWQCRVTLSKGRYIYKGHRNHRHKDRLMAQYQSSRNSNFVSLLFLSLGLSTATHTQMKRDWAQLYAAMISVNFWRSWSRSATIQRICKEDQPLYKKWDVQTVVLHTNATPGIKNVLQWMAAD